MADDENLEVKIDEADDRRASWADAPILARAEMLVTIAGHKAVDGRGINLFRNALSREPRSDLLRYYVGPNFYHPGSHYIYTTPDPSRYRFKNWRPEITAKAIEGRSIACCGLFSNTLAWIDQHGLPPRDRTYNAGYTIYTIEFDSLSIDEQLRIIYSGRLKRIDAQLRGYRDYRGYEVVYSGGKSLHYHFCFDLRHLKRDLAVQANSSYRDNWSQDLPDCLLRPAYKMNWDRLAALFCDIAEITRTQFEPDPRLESWEQLRRCPWAFRLVSGAHPLGLPSGHLVRQPVLASGIFQNTRRDATEWFHDPAKLGDLCKDEDVRRRPKIFIEPEFTVNTQELELFDQYAAGMFRQIVGAEYPKFAHFEANGTGFKCYFYNDHGDINPSSFCEGNRNRILLQGRHGFGSDGVVLGATPNQIFDWILAREGDGHNRQQDWITRRYTATVHDRESLIRFLDDHMAEMIALPAHCVPPPWVENLIGRDEGQHTHVAIRGPQGCGKSTITMRKLPAIYENDPGVIYFSSPSIAQAEEKISSFERVNQDKQFIPYLYLSLTALYERFCSASDRFDQRDILEEGGSSWLHAVYERQREVYEAMFAYRCRLLDLRTEGKIPVLFGTHETMRQHTNDGMTRLFYATDFSEKWFTTMTPHERGNWRSRLLGQNRIHRVIVDEVTAHDLVSIHKCEIVEWAQGCAREIGFDNIPDIAERYMRFLNYLCAHPSRDMTWNLLLEVLKCEYTEEHLVEVSDREVPFDDKDGIYAKVCGQLYYVRSRGWWNDFWRVTMLTTEAIPTRLIETIDAESAGRGETQDDRFKIYEFGLPASARDVVTVELQRECKRSILDDLVRAYKATYPRAEIIADMVKYRISEFSVNTHLSAKGSNAYIDSDIVAFYNALSPALFGELGALNTRFGRSDLVRLFYTDRFDQTCGRNRGFRGKKNKDHRAVFPPRLNSWLASAMTEASYVPVYAKPSVDLSDGQVAPRGSLDVESDEPTGPA